MSEKNQTDICAFCPLPLRDVAHFSGCCLGKVWMNVELRRAASLPGGLRKEWGLLLFHLCWAGVGGSQSGNCFSSDVIPEFQILRLPRGL